MKLIFIIVMMFALVGVVSLAIITVDFIFTVFKNIKKDDGVFDERVSNSKTRKGSM